MAWREKSEYFGTRNHIKIMSKDRNSKMKIKILKTKVPICETHYC